MRSLLKSFDVRAWQHHHGTQPIWIHAASTGESKSCVALIAKLRKHCGWPILITHRSARALDWPIDGVDSIPGVHRIIAPNELIAYAFLREIKPRLSIFVESELWPFLIHFTRQQNIPLVLVNGRLSDVAVSRWNRWTSRKWLANYMLSCFDIVHCQSQNDCHKFQQLCPSLKHILVGNLKPASTLFNADLNNNQVRNGSNVEVTSFFKNLKPGWAAVSLHDGEFDFVCNAHHLARLQEPLVIVPRHPKPGRELIQKVDESIYVLNAMNVVETTSEWAAKGLGVCLVGGSLPSSVHKDGHNILEPLYRGCKVLHGPHMDAFKSVLDLIDPKDREEIVDAKQLSRTLQGIKHPPRPDDIQRRQIAFQTSFEAVEELWQHIAPFLQIEIDKK